MNKLLTSMVANFSPRFSPSAPAAARAAWPVATDGAAASCSERQATTFIARVMQAVQRPLAAALKHDDALSDWMAQTQAAREAELRYASILTSSKIL